MIDLQNTHHHVEFIDLPDLKPIELHGLFRLSRYLEPYTNRLIMMCDVQTMNGNKVIMREVKPVNIRVGDIPEIVGCSTVTANKLVRTLRDKNIMLRDKTFFMNPKFVRVHNSLATANTVKLFEEQPNYIDLDECTRDNGAADNSPNAGETLEPNDADACT
ncbi:MAG: hypothetical protein IJ668_11935 [Selenomonadaceae bacterium]|nr:hypothetical protein [Selenomonadaceae bacterium]